MASLLDRYRRWRRKTSLASKEDAARRHDHLAAGRERRDIASVIEGAVPPALLPDRVGGPSDSSITEAPARKLSRLSFDYNLTEHCNLSCCECDHASPLLPKKFASVEAFSRDLTALASIFHSQQLRILGGEPLLHPRLIDFLTEARRIGIADSIVLVTNGVLLHKAPPELWGLIDELWISAYPGIKRKLDDEECARICKAHNVRLKINDYEVFYKTLVNNCINDPELVKVIFRDCKNAGEWSCHTVHDGRFYKCSIAPFMGARLALRGVAFDNPVDGVALHDNANLYEEVDRCLNDQTPLAACSYCLGTSGPPVAQSAEPHRSFAAIEGG
jgi:GTP 3',8-cyclase